MEVLKYCVQLLRSVGRQHTFKSYSTAARCARFQCLAMAQLFSGLQTGSSSLLARNGAACARRWYTPRSRSVGLAMRGRAVVASMVLHELLKFLERVTILQYLELFFFNTHTHTHTRALKLHLMRVLPLQVKEACTSLPKVIQTLNCNIYLAYVLCIIFFETSAPFFPCWHIYI